MRGDRADRVIRWSTAGAVVGMAAVASYEHAYALVRAHSEAGWTARLVPSTADGLIYASSMVLLDAARRKMPVPALARWLLGVGIAATLAANVAHGLGHGLAGAAVAAWPVVALVRSCELLMMIIRGAQVPADVMAVPGRSGRLPDADPLQVQATRLFADDLAAGRVPSVRAIRTRLHVGQLRTQRAQAYLASLAACKYSHLTAGARQSAPFVQASSVWRCFCTGEQRCSAAPDPGRILIPHQP